MLAEVGGTRTCHVRGGTAEGQTVRTQDGPTAAVQCVRDVGRCVGAPPAARVQQQRVCSVRVACAGVYSVQVKRASWDYMQNECHHDIRPMVARTMFVQSFAVLPRPYSLYDCPVQELNGCVPSPTIPPRRARGSSSAWEPSRAPPNKVKVRR